MTRKRGARTFLANTSNHPDLADPAQPPHDFSAGSPPGQGFVSKANGGGQTKEYDLIALGQLGLGEKEKASASCQQARELHPADLGAYEHSHPTVAR